MSPMYERYWRTMLILGAIVWVSFELGKWAWEVVGW